MWFGGARKTVFEEVEELKKHPPSEQPFLRVSSQDQFDAVCSLENLRSLRLVCFSTDINWSKFSQLKKLTKLHLSFTDAQKSPDSALRVVATLPELNDLDLYCSRNGNPAPVVTTIPRMRALRTLTLEGSYLAVYRFDSDFDFRSLQSLTIDARPETQESLKWFKCLKYLKLRNINLSDDSLAALASMDQLQEFESNRPGHFPYSKWKDIRRLSLNGISSADLAEIAHCDNLTALKVNVNECTDACLTSLSNLRQLHDLDLQIGPRFSPNKDKALSNKCDGSGLADVFSSCPLQTLSIGGIPANDRMLNSISHATGLTKLCYFEMVTPDLAKYIDKLTNLQELLVEWPLDRELSCLQQCTHLAHLKSLNLRKVTSELPVVTDRDLQMLLNFPGLEELDLDSQHLTDACLPVLGKLQELKTLKLGQTALNGNGLSLVLSLPQLTELDLSGTQVSDDTINREMVDGSNIQMLNLSNTKITNRSLSTLQRLVNLQKLGLAGCAVDDAGMQEISNANLTAINICGTEVTEHGIDALAKLPNLKNVVAYGSGIKYGAQLPKSLSVAWQAGWFETDYDSPRMNLKDFAPKPTDTWVTGEYNQWRLAREAVKSAKYQLAIDEYSKALDGLQHPKGYVCSMAATPHIHDVFEVYDERGWLYAAVGRYSEALKDLDDANRICRASAIARTHRGYVLATQGRLGDALKEFSRAIDIKPDVPVAYRYRSAVYASLRQNRLAKADQSAYAKLRGQHTDMDFLPDLSLKIPRHR